MKELAAEKAKTVSVETKLKEQLLAREQEVAAIQARMQASYQDHVNETQQLQGKVGGFAILLNTCSRQSLEELRTDVLVVLGLVCSADLACWHKD